MSEFNKEVYENLKKEIENLNPKLAKVREDGNFITYKNLVNAYSDVLRLIEHCEEMIKQDNNVVYIDYERLENEKIRLHLYKNKIQYIVDNTKNNFSLDDLVHILSNHLNDNDIIYVDDRGFGIFIYDTLKEMKFRVEKLELVRNTDRQFNM
jgi:hypothetical protein